MRDETEARFRRLLERHDRESLRAVTPDERRALRAREWDTQFLEKAETVVRPILARLHTLMHDHGLRSGIVLNKRRTEPDGSATPASITFEFQVLTDPETHGFPITLPTLAFIGDPVHGMIMVHENSVLPFIGGHVGIIDQCPIEGLTGDFVERHLFSIAAKVLRGTDVE
jgi:hypothetical protein